MTKRVTIILTALALALPVAACRPEPCWDQIQRDGTVLRVCR